MVADELTRALADRPPSAAAGLEPSALVALDALAGEVVAFQVLLRSPAAVDGVTVTVALAPRDRADTGPTPRVDGFLAETFAVESRSRSRDPRESLGWTAAARPPDDDVLGLLPDPLVPLAGPFTLPAGRTQTVWIDLVVPLDISKGAWTGALTVTAPGHPEVVRPLRLTVAPATLPYGAVPVLVAYDPDTLIAHVPGGLAAEIRLFQLLHAHGLDALADVRDRAALARLDGAVSGRWFLPAEGYRGPGAGVPVSAATIGVYGGLGAPSADKIAEVEAVARAAPAGLPLFVYAVDEACRSPLGPAWRRALSASAARGRVLAAHTCHEDVAGQDVDLALVPAESFDGERARLARAAGTQAWVYNGRLPRAPSLLLDEPPGAGVALGLIGASYAVDHWFLWESLYPGPAPRRDPQNFRNSDGDVSLGGGLLVYPGDGPGDAALLPSMRLKRLRRGLFDAGLIALANHANPERTRAILAWALPAALDDHAEDAPARWDVSGRTFARARAELRQLIPPGAQLSTAAARAELAALAEARFASRPGRTPLGVLVVVLATGLAFLGAAWASAREAQGALAPAQRRSSPK